ncbi:hypothetical protein AVEN_126911-1 [Araneus ventricosus]|uniref:Uncharacterized protein n=1 Tax=Araneus ventricosus TaxID=182803 RepID=A0A4Y2C3X3_ARAVE|nr:hypothetical protein AVEN_126911-1 [Araneus ventricosus]
MELKKKIPVKSEIYHYSKELTTLRMSDGRHSMQGLNSFPNSRNGEILGTEFSDKENKNIPDNTDLRIKKYKKFDIFSDKKLSFAKNLFEQFLRD